MLHFQRSDSSHNRACAAVTEQQEREDTKMLQAAVDLMRLLGVGGHKKGLGAEIDGMHKVVFKVACTWRDLFSALEEEDSSQANISLQMNAAIHGFNELTGYVFSIHDCFDTQICYAHAVIAFVAGLSFCGKITTDHFLQVMQVVHAYVLAQQHPRNRLVQILRGF